MVGSNMDKIYIVMDYIEHDLKALMETMKESFSIGWFFYATDVMIVFFHEVETDSAVVVVVVVVVVRGSSDK